MAYPSYLRRRARELRVAKHLSIDELAERLALPKTTIYYWVRDLPLGREPRASGQNGTRAMQRKYRRLREDAYEQGRAEYDELMLAPTFRDFVVLYIAEGYKRDRNTLSIANSDPAVIVMSAGWLERLSGRVPSVRIQYHADQSTETLRTFWAAKLGIDPSTIRFHPKSNSSQLRTRTWRCAYGVAAVAIHDTLLRARLQAWMDLVFASWS
jgi:transcriptional regulator with XRE-family HTH domain